MTLPEDFRGGRGIFRTCVPNTLLSQICHRPVIGTASNTSEEER
jgi:hypothetical protein